MFNSEVLTDLPESLVETSNDLAQGVTQKRKYSKGNKKNCQNQDAESKSVKFQCIICGKSMSSQSALVEHTRLHTGEKPFSCKECDASFSVKSNLRTHMRTHTGERPFICGVCNKSFSQSCHLHIHMRTHTQERPYQCDKCHKSFSASTTLRYHMMLHSGVTKHKCEVCGKGFVCKAWLNDHYKVHSNIKNFHCDICGKGFKDKSYINKHKKKFCSNDGYKKRWKKTPPSDDSSEDIDVIQNLSTHNNARYEDTSVKKLPNIKETLLGSSHIDSTCDVYDNFQPLFLNNEITDKRKLFSFEKNTSADSMKTIEYSLLSQDPSLAADLSLPHSSVTVDSYISPYQYKALTSLDSECLQPQNLSQQPKDLSFAKRTYAEEICEPENLSINGHISKLLDDSDDVLTMQYPQDLSLSHSQNLCHSIDISSSVTNSICDLSVNNVSSLY